MSRSGPKEKVTDAEILAVFRETTDPVLSTSEVADRLSLGRRGTLNRLDELAAKGELRRKELSKRSLVWWDPGWTSVGERCALCGDVAEYELTTTAAGTNPVARLILTHDGRFVLCEGCLTPLVGLREAFPPERVFVDYLDGDGEPIPMRRFDRHRLRGTNEAGEPTPEERRTNR